MQPLRLMGIAAAALAVGALVAPSEATAGDRHRHGHPGRGWGPPPRAYYAPPPRVYFAPPPRAYYAPPPRAYYAAPPPVYYAPPPVYYGPPGVSLNFRF